jgi:hypothetical protein
MSSWDALWQIYEQREYERRAREDYAWQQAQTRSTQDWCERALSSLRRDCDLMHRVTFDYLRETWEMADEMERRRFGKVL